MPFTQLVCVRSAILLVQTVNPKLRFMHKNTMSTCETLSWVEALACHARFGHVGCPFLSQSFIVVETRLSTARYDIIMA